MTGPLERLWGRLASDGSETSGWLRIRVPDLPEIPLYVAINSSTGLDGLILEIPTRSVDPSALSERTRGLEVTSAPLTPGRSGITRLILGLSEPAFRDVFRALCADLADALSGLTNVDDAAREFSRRLRRWQRFLQSHGAGGLSDAECLGLVGEMAVLQQLLSRGSDPSLAVGAWTGPEWDARDFTLPGGDIEVKTTSSQAPSEVGVSSLQQLDSQTGRPLFIVHLVIARNPTVGFTLPERVNELVDLSDEAVGLFKDKLLAAGYLDEHRELYRTPCYQVLAENAYAVVDGFPRLISDNVPAGVTRATYSLSLSAIRTYRLDEFEPSTLLEYYSTDK